MRPGDPPTVQTAYKLLEAMFFDPRKFDFSRVGRLKFNIKMGKPERDRINDPLLSAKDFYEVVAYVLKMRKNPSEYQADDIDHLGNRRVRAVGELCLHVPDGLDGIVRLAGLVADAHKEVGLLLQVGGGRLAPRVFYDREWLGVTLPAHVEADGVGSR